MKEDPQYKDWTVQQQLDNFSSWMASMTVAEKKALSAMGAISLSRKQAIDLLQSNESLLYIFATMVEITYKGQQG
eukprot:8958300-Heterocapsa_arctica.AAC.1